MEFGLKWRGGYAPKRWACPPSINASLSTITEKFLTRSLKDQNGSPIGSLVTKREIPKRRPGSRSRIQFPDAYTIFNKIAHETRRSAIVALGLTLFLLTVHIHVFAPKGLVDRNKVRDLIAARDAEITEATKQNDNLRKEIATLESDPAAIERMARNELSMAKPDETIYRTNRDTIPRYVLNLTTQSP